MREPKYTGTVLSVTRHFPGTADKTATVNALKELFLEIAPEILVEGIVPGHFKGAIQCGEGILALSLTRADAIDETQNPAWQVLEYLRDFTVTVNLLSILSCPVTKADLASRLSDFPGANGSAIPNKANNAPITL